MPELEIQHDKYSMYERFRAQMVDKYHGELLAYPENGFWCIEDIHAWPQRKKIGSALLKEFSAFIGENQQIEGCIIHIPTIRAIRTNGLLPTVVVDEVIMDDPEKLSLLPITKFFRNGGISVSHLRFSRTPVKGREKDILAFYVVYVHGVTNLE